MRPNGGSREPTQSSTWLPPTFPQEQAAARTGCSSIPTCGRHSPGSARAWMAISLPTRNTLTPGARRKSGQSSNASGTGESGSSDPHLYRMNRSISRAERSTTKEVILKAVRCGCNHSAAATAGDIHRATLYRWLSSDDRFAERFTTAWDAGTERRAFRQWATHPFRGFRPPTGKGTRGFPRFGRHWK